MSEVSADGAPRIEITTDRATRFGASDHGRHIRVVPNPLFEAGDTIFTIGSSFAQSVRARLVERGHPVTPVYGALDIDPTRQAAGRLRHINFYTAATIRQEIARSLSERRAEPVFDAIAPGHWPVEPGALHRGAAFEPWEARFQDPRRHGVVARSEADIVDLMGKIDRLVAEGLAAAAAFIVTLAVTEDWVDPATGHCLWSRRAANVSGDPDRFEFRPSGYEENHEDMAWVCETIANRFPGRPIVLTVSPVVPPQTFGSDDVVIANTEAKAVLRAVAGSLADRFDHVTYWPSFELSMASTERAPDGRHLPPDVVAHDVDQFVAAHRSPSPTEVPDDVD